MKPVPYSDAHATSLTRKWIIGTCSQGEDCWCRTIKPDPPIHFLDGDTTEEYYVVGVGSLNRELVEYLVELHNKNLKKL